MRLIERGNWTMNHKWSLYAKIVMPFYTNPIR
uniref:Uncharacterized protein n=1 Tax=Arundo donax TaxID=35708 RepID=A0A0A9AFF2_ARUDO